MDGCLGCFHFLDSLICHLATHPEVRLLCLSFWVTTTHFSMAAIPLYTPTNCARVPITTHAWRHLKFPVCFFNSIYPGRSGLYLIVVWFAFSIHDVEHPSLCLLAIWMSSLEKCLFKSFDPCLIGLSEMAFFIIFFYFWVVRVLVGFWFCFSLFFEAGSL
jgi:hypothetical protein